MINLRPVQPDDITFFRIWWKDKELIKATSGDFSPLSEEQVTEYFDTILLSSDNIHRMIETKEGQTIGHVSLIKQTDEWYETQIVIGDKSSQNKGYGSDAIRQIIALAKSHNITRIYLKVRPENVRAIKSYQNAGFYITDQLTTDNPLQPVLIRMEIIN